MLHDKGNQDEESTNTSMPWKNPSLGLVLPSMLCVTKTFESMIFCASQCKWIYYDVMDMHMKSQTKSYVKMKKGGKILGYDTYANPFLMHCLPYHTEYLGKHPIFSLAIPIIG